MRLNRRDCCALLLGAPWVARAQPRTPWLAEDFERLDAQRWSAEIAPKSPARVVVEGGRLLMDTAGGVTVWLQQPLPSEVFIEYRRRVVLEGGPNDRLSDLNQFWMASDPSRPGPIRRDGVFESYDDLSLYYLGVGGNSNSTTRFRKYQGGQRPLLQERLGPAWMLQPNHDYLVQTEVSQGRSRVWVDGQLVVDYLDPQPLTQGYFGLRSTWSRQQVWDFKVYRLG